MKKELGEFEKGPEAKQHLKPLTATLKEIPNWKKWNHDNTGGFWF